MQINYESQISHVQAPAILNESLKIHPLHNIAISWKLASSMSWVSENVFTLQAWFETDL